MSDGARPTPPPGAIFEQSEQAVEFVKRALNIVLDYKPETLPVLDHYLRQVPRDRLEVVELIAAASGAYFGEVVRRAIGARWEAETLVLDGGTRFSPAGMAFEAIVQDDEEGRAQLDVPPEALASVEAALEQRGEVAVDEYYSLSGRLEMLHLVADAVAAATMAGRPAETVTDEEDSE